MDKECLCNLVKEQEEAIVAICKKYANIPGSLISVLNDVQEYFGFLPIQVQEVIAREMNLSLSEVYGVTTFYSRFSLTPTGKYKVAVCLGTACYVKGAQALIDGYERTLGVKVGETTEDNQFTLEATRCIGACGLAPVVTVGEDVYGNLKPENISKSLANYKDKGDVS